MCVQRLSVFKIQPKYDKNSFRDDRNFATFLHFFDICIFIMRATNDEDVCR